MANYEKQVEQEAAYPIPISLYNCYRTVRQEKRGIAIYILLIAFLMPHCPVTVVQRYRDGVCSLLFHLFFIICHPYIPLEMIFYTLYSNRCPSSSVYTQTCAHTRACTHTHTHTHAHTHTHTHTPQPQVKEGSSEAGIEFDIVTVEARHIPSTQSRGDPS